MVLQTTRHCLPLRQGGPTRSIAWPW